MFFFLKFQFNFPFFSSAVQSICVFGLFLGVVSQVLSVFDSFIKCGMAY